MSSRFHTLPLESCLEVLLDYRGKSPPKSESGIPVISAKVVKAGSVTYPIEQKIAPDFYPIWMTRGLPNPGDVVMTTEGPLGEVAQLDENTAHYALGQRIVVLRGQTGILDNTFLKFLLQSPRQQEILRAYATGTTVEGISQKALRSIPITIPDYPEQVAIGRILGTLDEKIELNRRINETLEAMARALFKSWFVDFEPVHAKAEGRDPGLPNPLAELFPAYLTDSEFGDIPQGWRVQPFANTIEIIGGGTPKTSIAEYWSGDIPWFSIVDTPTRSDVWVMDTEKKITREGVENSSTRVLPVGTTIISARGTVGRIALVGVPMAMNQSCYGLRGNVGKHGAFTYFATRELVASLQQHAHGSVFDTITRDTLAGISIVFPPTVLIEVFEDCVDPILKRIRVAILSSSSLADLRDSLLPKLISGELHIEKAERIIGNSH